VEAPGLRIPSDLSTLGRAPDQGGYTVPFCGQSLDESAADEPACSAHCHAKCTAMIQ